MAAAVAWAVALLVTLLLTPAVARVARRWGLLDRPDGERKHHPAEVPLLGGVAIMVGAVVGVVATSGPSEVDGTRLAWVFLLAAVLCVVGLLDDLRPSPVPVRLLAQLAVAATAWTVGLRVRAFPTVGLDAAATLLWVVGIANAFNLLDNMDGLSAGLATVAAGAFAVMAVIEGVPVVAVGAGAVAGAAGGFLVHNRPPARVFMGDAGALFLGTSLALLGVELRFDNLVEVTFLVPIIVLGVPLFDSGLVVLDRVVHGRPVFAAARDHVSHRMVRVGLPERVAVGLLVWAAICLGWLALVISQATTQVGWMLGVLVAALAVFFGVVLWRVPPRGSAHRGASPAADVLDAGGDRR
ncbi:MAG TPA: MraY family glycosyltransferase [Nitriliruptorales bacterium]|nr:MraY family glycosyltransferase [Nitriliruptorales bacterium]